MAGLPTRTALAPSDKALMMSTPVLIPLSKRTVILSPTASTISGSISKDPTAPSSCRPKLCQLKRLTKNQSFLTSMVAHNNPISTVLDCQFCVFRVLISCQNSHRVGLQLLTYLNTFQHNRPVPMFL